MKKRPKRTTTTVSKSSGKVKKTATKKGGKKLPPKVKEVILKPEKKAKKLDENKYIKISSSEPSEKFKEFGERVQRKELKWAYFATENSIGMHYYLILNVEK
jgi:hypothetical protein